MHVPNTFKQIEITEYEFSRLLTRLKAINNWKTIEDSNVWYGPDGQAVAMCIYDNSLMTVKYHIRKTIDELTGKYIY